MRRPGSVQRHSGLDGGRQRTAACFYQAMKTSGREWPVVPEDVQERCLKRVVGRVLFIEGFTPRLQTQSKAGATQASRAR